MASRGLAFFTAIAAVTLGCGKSSDNCPGLCPDDSSPPTMTITTADGAASIASAKVANGPCTVLLLHSAGEAGLPQSYGEVQVTYAGPLDNPPLCVIALTSTWGQVEDKVAQVTSSASSITCCPYGTCCPPSDASLLHYRVVFKVSSDTVTFQPAPDGGAATDAADAPAPLDAGAGEVAVVPDDGASLDAGADDGGMDMTLLDLAVDVPAVSAVDDAEPGDLSGVP